MKRIKPSLYSKFGVMLIFVLLLSACGGAAKPAANVPPAEQTGSLTVLDWAGYDAADFWVDFQKTYPKIKVNFEIGESDADIYGKMKAGDQADIFHPYTGWLQFYVDEGLVEEIDTSKLTNWDKVPDNFKKIGQILHDKIRAAEQGDNIPETLRLTQKLTEIKRLEQSLVIHS